MTKKVHTRSNDILLYCNETLFLSHGIAWSKLVKRKAIFGRNRNDGKINFMKKTSSRSGLCLLNLRQSIDNDDRLDFDIASSMKVTIIDFR